ncbi:hypothetical protein DPMN_145485 [Dreissena polymorpha]|uniref:Uncharacterized protein n=1 Tax=Dreissena polymorpha TaxID=45954 RepID=A0A9D4F8H9_DREPO|nr:hypothetical protein DPMN_145485 [Dreissena polymorpha]
MEKILVFTMFCMALIAADEIQVRYSVHKTTGSESVTSTCLLQCATRFSSFEATGVRVSSSQCLCEALDKDWALTLPLQMSPGYVYMVKQENTQTFTHLVCIPVCDRHSCVPEVRRITST